MANNNFCTIFSVSFTSQGTVMKDSVVLQSQGSESKYARLTCLNDLVNKLNATNHKCLYEITKNKSPILKTIITGTMWVCIVMSIKWKLINSVLLLSSVIKSIL